MSQKVGSKDARLNSKGCLSCIRMKVKCDQGKPQCQRCKRADRECRYRDPNAVVFRMDYSTTLAQEGYIRHQELVQTLQTHAPPPTVSTDWIQSAVSHYFYNFVLPSQNGFPGLCEFLPRLYTTNTRTSCFQNAVEAISLANLALVRKMGEPQLRASRRLYSSALQQLRLALDSPEASSPSVLGTAVLLWQYDIIVGEDYLSSPSAHRKSQIDILRLRLASRPDGENWINQSVFANIQMLDIGASKRTTTDLPSVENITSSFSHLASLRRAISEVNNISATMPSFLRKTATFEEVSSYTQRLQEAESMLQSWEDQLPKHMKYSLVTNPLPRETVSYPAKVILLPCMNSAGIWTAYWMARLSLLRNMLLFHPTASSAGLFVAFRQEIRRSMLNIVDLVCSAIPYMLGRVRLRMGVSPEEPVPSVGAMFSTRALFICSQIPDLPEIQQNWILQCMCDIGNEKGIRQALLLRQEVLNARA